MYPIVRKETLADNIILMDIKAPRVANECLPGQFIIAKTEESVFRLRSVTMTERRRLSPSWYRRLAQEPSV